VNTNFTLLCLRSQALAVERFLKGRSADEKLTWLAGRGKVQPLSVFIPNAAPTYLFVSSIGIFFFSGEKLVFIGDHTTFTVEEDDN